jgi:hypothetical protein
VNYQPEAIKVKGLTQGKPNHLTKDQIAVKLTVDVPPEAFAAFEPDAIIEIPANLVQQPNVEVSVDPADSPTPETES